MSKKKVDELMSKLKTKTQTSYRFIELEKKYEELNKKIDWVGDYSKREMFVCAAMEAIVMRTGSLEHIHGEVVTQLYDKIAEQSVLIADAVLRKLDNESP